MREEAQEQGLFLFEPRRVCHFYFDVRNKVFASIQLNPSPQRAQEKQHACIFLQCKITCTGRVFFAASSCMHVISRATIFSSLHFSVHYNPSKPTQEEDKVHQPCRIAPAQKDLQTDVALPAIGMRLSKRMARLVTVDVAPAVEEEDHAVAVAAAAAVEETDQGQEIERTTGITDPVMEVEEDGMIGIAILQEDEAVEMITDRTGEDHVRGRPTVRGPFKGIVLSVFCFSSNSLAHCLFVFSFLLLFLRSWRTIEIQKPKE